MIPKAGKRYAVRTEASKRVPWAEPEVYECYGPWGVPGYWRFDALVPHEGDETRGVSFSVHEDDVIEERP